VGSDNAGVAIAVCIIPSGRHREGMLPQLASEERGGKAWVGSNHDEDCPPVSPSFRLYQPTVAARLGCLDNIAEDH